MFPTNFVIAFEDVLLSPFTDCHRWTWFIKCTIIAGREVMKTQNMCEKNCRPWFFTSWPELWWNQREAVVSGSVSMARFDLTESFSFQRNVGANSYLPWLVSLPFHCTFHWYAFRWSSQCRIEFQVLQIEWWFSVFLSAERKCYGLILDLFRAFFEGFLWKNSPNFLFSTFVAVE